MKNRLVFVAVLSLLLSFVSCGNSEAWELASLEVKLNE
jgi:hypothetical protein